MILDKVIQLIIDLFKKYLPEKPNPRAKAARAFVNLYNSLIECHESYILWQKKNRGKKSKEYIVWQKSISGLSNALDKIRNQLKIFAPDIYKYMREYRASEMAISNYDDLNKKDLDLLINSGLIAPILNITGSLIDENLSKITEKELVITFTKDSSFKKTEELLRNYIKQEFKIEDLF